MRLYSVFPITSSLADRFAITDAPPSASFPEGGSGVQRSSQSSMPSLNSGIEAHKNTVSVSTDTVCPQRFSLISLPLLLRRFLPEVKCLTS